MPAATISPPVDSAWSRLAGVILPVTIVGAVLVFIVPVPPAVLDLLQSANITPGGPGAADDPGDPIAGGLQRVPDDPPDDHADPAGPQRRHDPAGFDPRGPTRGWRPAGGVVRSFGEFVAGDQVLVGAILFGILVVIQFVVITRGATRISEVAARFMLDGLPGAADGDRRRPPRRPDRPARGPPPPRGRLPDGRLLRGDGRGRQVRPRRRRRRPDHHRDQHRRGADPRRLQVRHGPRRGRGRLHQADHRRRPGQPGPGVPDLALGRPDRDAKLRGHRPRGRRRRPSSSAGRSSSARRRPSSACSR